MFRKQFQFVDTLPTYTERNSAIRNLYMSDTINGEVDFLKVTGDSWQLKQKQGNNLLDMSVLTNENGNIDSKVSIASNINKINVVEGKKYLLITNGVNNSSNSYSSIYFGEDDLSYSNESTYVLGTGMSYKAFEMSTGKRSILTATKTCTLTKIIVHGEEDVIDAYTVSEFGLFEYNDEAIDSITYEPFQPTMPSSELPSEIYNVNGKLIGSGWNIFNAEWFVQNYNKNGGTSFVQNDGKNILYVAQEAFQEAKTAMLIPFSNNSNLHINYDVEWISHTNDDASVSIFGETIKYSNEVIHKNYKFVGNILKIGTWRYSGEVCIKNICVTVENYSDDYYHQSSFINLPVLRSIRDNDGNIVEQDTLYVDRLAERAWIKRNIQEIELDGVALEYRFDNVYKYLDDVIRFDCYTMNVYSAKNGAPVISNYFNYEYAGWSSNNECIFWHGSLNIHFYISLSKTLLIQYGYDGETDASALDAGNAWLQDMYDKGNPVKVMFVRQTPVTELLNYSDYILKTSQYETSFYFDDIEEHLQPNISVETKALVNRNNTKLYGVRFDSALNSGDTVHRLYDAAGLVANVGTDTETAINDFDNIYPWSERKRCCGYFNEYGNFVVNAYEGERDYATDGSNGEVWVETPLFYYKHIYGDDDSEEIVISAHPISGFEPSPIHISEDGTLLQKAYTAAYPMGIVDGLPTSRSGVYTPVMSLNSGMTNARLMGERYTTTTMAEQYTKCLLMWVEFATRDIQTVMKGCSSLSYSASHTAVVAEDTANRIIISNANASTYVVGQGIAIGTSLGSTNVANNRTVTAIESYDEENTAISFDGEPVNIAVGNIVFAIAWKTGTCDGVLSSSGSYISNTSGKYTCIYRGEETPFGNAFELISDVLFKREGEGTIDSPYTYDIYYLKEPLKYNNGNITEDYVKINYQLSTAEGYIKKLGFDSRFPWLRISCEVGAGFTTCYSDYYYRPVYAVTSAAVGGAWYYVSYCGPCCLDCYGGTSNAYITRRARLSYHR